MIILELSNKYGNRKMHFIGTDTETILEDAKLFGDFTQFRELTIKEARAMNMEYLDEGIAAVQKGIQDSFKLLSP